MCFDASQWRKAEPIPKQWGHPATATNRSFPHMVAFSSLWQHWWIRKCRIKNLKPRSRTSSVSRFHHYLLTNGGPREKKNFSCSELPEELGHKIAVSPHEWRKILLVFQRQTTWDEPRALTKLGKVLKSVRWCHPGGWSCLCGTRSSPLCPASALTHWFHGTRLTFWLARSSLVGQGGGSCDGGLGSEWTDTSECWDIGWPHLAPLRNIWQHVIASTEHSFPENLTPIIAVQT